MENKREIVNAFSTKAKELVVKARQEKQSLILLDKNISIWVSNKFIKLTKDKTKISFGIIGEWDYNIFNNRSREAGTFKGETLIEAIKNEAYDNFFISTPAKDKKEIDFSLF